ncbi:unnamed protein product [Polarella glacialis]|uniref:Uncharacterized protein n=1 Tax=Polarella glacialis TaxID=89957 RepID=A0A813IH74_POLGL|nr:unnamed protein product [Polarella glacialis]
MEVIQPLAEGAGLKALKDEGMPTIRHPFIFGTLFLILNIKFPDEVDATLIPRLREALPGPGREVPNASTAKVCFFEDMDPMASVSSERQGGAPGREGVDGPGQLPHGPGCPHQ